MFGAHLGAALTYWVVTTYNRELPKDLLQLHVYRPERATIIYSADGEKIGVLATRRRELVPLERFPDHVRRAFIAAEDARFYQHLGFDPIGIGRAAWANLSGGAKQGASTITQQVARMLLLTNRRTYER